MDTDAYVYTSYIRTSPDDLWKALTEPELTRRYWGVAFETEWTPGAGMVWEEGGRRTADPEQVVVEAVPGRRLAYTWHTFTPEWAKAVRLDDEVYGLLSGERRSTVAFDLEPSGDDMVKLTVTHGGLEPDGIMRGLIGEGWPAIVSSLKSLLETGEELPEPPR
ncbi:SRPBCC family protein [Streptomyces sp. NPDC085529]|uniref:SRPBCC family protein n=1 Tax=Streptomyces sp. NPDC085529 TaxID=3365729 RepID=UPI0037D29EF2